jgi:methylated-DNA-[protein]-cysteine S-methyltransferase
VDKYLQTMMSPQGKLLITASEKGVTSITFADQTEEALRTGHANELTQAACEQLTAYFSKQLTRFSLPLDAKGTHFQQTVWAALASIEYGNTKSYQDIANAIDNPKAVRAVGLANGKNPIAIVVPCHRVIGKNNRLTGYAGGVDKKQYLLKLEGAQGVLWD